MYNPHHPRQSFRTHLKGDARLFGHPPQSIPIRAHAHPWLLAQHSGDPVREDGAHLSPAHPGGIEERTARAHSPGHRRNQPTARCAPLESLRSPDVSNGYHLVKRYTSGKPRIGIRKRHTTSTKTAGRRSRSEEHTSE